MDKIIKSSRLAVIILLIVAFTSIIMISLYRIQIVEGAAYAAQAKNSISSTTTVAAARGNIIDRYGRVLVTNRTCNNIIINSDELFGDRSPEAIALANATLLELARTVIDCGDKYTDTLPITMEAPFEYTDNISDIQRTRLNAYFEANGLLPGATAVELMASFRTRYRIDNNYTSEETRIIAGIRYEINVRHLVHTSDYIFAEDVSIDLITRLLENDVPGFQVVQSFVREFNTTAAAHILGYIGMMDEGEYKQYGDEGYKFNALVGKDGIEKAFESELHGVDGEAVITSTKGGTVISTNYTQEVEPGNNVAVTIDIGLQEAAENSLNAYIESENAAREESNAQYEGIPGYEGEIQDLITGGAVVAIDIKTGEPLAIASAPDYDIATLLENYSSVESAENAPLFNRALNGTYAPGSTFKPVTALAVLNEEIVSTAYTVYDKGIFDKYAEAGYAPKCWIYPLGTHGDVNVTGAIEHSCNYYFYTVGDLLGIDLLSYYALRFGLGVPTGIELTESTGHMSTEEYKLSLDYLDDPKWRIGDTLQAAIGQSFSVFTPMQLAVYTAALASSGTRYEASILKSVRSYDYSEILYEREPVVAENVDLPQEYYDAVHLGMYNAANNAGTTVYNILGNFDVKVAAKTGTAQLGEGVTNNGIFICYAPYDDPEIAVAVVIEKGGSGSAIVSVARDVLEYYFNFKNSAVTVETENTLLR